AVDPMVRSMRTSGALRDLFIALAEERPLVIHIDDLQRSDLDSLRLIGALLEAPLPARMLLVVSYRPDPNDTDVLAKYLDLVSRPRPGLRRIVLDMGPLRAEDTEMLVRSILEMAAPGSAEMVSTEITSQIA